jgi:hypothetical protein
MKIKGKKFSKIFEKENIHTRTHARTYFENKKKTPTYSKPLRGALSFPLSFWRLQHNQRLIEDRICGTGRAKDKSKNKRARPFLPFLVYDGFRTASLDSKHPLRGTHKMRISANPHTPTNAHIITVFRPHHEHLSQVELAGPQVELARPQVELAGPQVELAGQKVELADHKWN